MTDHADTSPPSQAPMDPELLALAQQVFDLARRGDAAMLAAVIEKGVPPNLRNDKGDSLVMLASYHGHADAVRTLLERGADPDLRNDNGQTPIAGAAFKGFDKVIETLLAHGADVEGASPDGRTALMVAAMFNRICDHGSADCARCGPAGPRCEWRDGGRRGRPHGRRRCAARD